MTRTTSEWARGLGLIRCRPRGIDAVIDEWDRLGEDGYWDLPVNEIAALRRHGVPELGAIRDAHGSWTDLQLAWFRRQLVADSEVEPPDAPVRIFVMGRDEWRDEPCWPPERAVDERWFLRSDGSLTTARPEPDADPSEFVYDPADPVPTVGGHGVMWPGYATGDRPGRGGGSRRRAGLHVDSAAGGPRGHRASAGRPARRELGAVDRLGGSTLRRGPRRSLLQPVRRDHPGDREPARMHASRDRTAREPPRGRRQRISYAAARPCYIELPVVAPQPR
jgi:hypothetical protein